VKIFAKAAFLVLLLAVNAKVSHETKKYDIFVVNEEG